MKRLVTLACCLALWGGSASASDLLPEQLYTTVVKTATPSSNNTGASLWTPTSGYRFVLQGCLVSSAQPASVRLQVASVDVIPTIYLPSYGTEMIGGNNAPIYVSAVDAVLTYTNVGALSIMCWGYESTP